MKIQPRNRNESGIALVIAMTTVIILTILVGAFALSMKVETRLAMKSNSDAQLLWLGRAGVERARWILALETMVPNQSYDSLDQIWAGGSGALSETNSPLNGISLQDYPVGNGTVSLKIVDLERYANINTANAQNIQQALTLMGANATDISVVSDSILDWIDNDDATRPAGAENDYYQTLNPPYYAKNAPIDDISELLLIKGVTPHMFTGGPATNVNYPTFHHKLGVGTRPGEEPDYPFGLKDVFTAISSGKININTANTNVLQLLPGVDAPAAMAIVQQRAGPDGVDGTEDDVPFRSVSQISSAGVNPQLAGQLGQVCTVRSYAFRVEITAKVNGLSRTYCAILARNSGTDIQVVGFYSK